MPIFRHAPVFVLLILVSVVSGFAATGAVTAGWLWLWLGAGVWLAIGKPICSSSGLPGLMLAFLLWISTSVWWSHSPYSSWYAVLIFSAIPISFIAWHLTPDPDVVWKHLRKAFIAGVWIVSLWGIYQVFFLGLSRALGPVADPNVYACILNLAWFPLLAAFFGLDASKSDNPRVRQMILGVSLLLVGLAFFAAASRGATLAWLLLMPLSLWAFRHQPNFRNKTFVILVLVLASYFIVAAVAHSHLVDRASADYLAQDASVSLRLLIWRTTLDMFALHPWLGTGLGTWSGIYPAFRQAEDNGTAGYYAHNDYLQIAQEGGLVTFVLFVLILCYFVWLLFRAVSSTKERPIQVENVGLMLGVMAACLHASVNFIFYLVYINIIVGIYAARVWQSSCVSRRFVLAGPKAISPVILRLVILFVFSFPLSQIVLHAASETFLNGHSRLLSIVRKQFPQLTPYEIARFVAAVRPQEYIAQRYIVDSAAQTLNEVDPDDTLLKQTLLAETLERYDELRQSAPDSAEIGATEANFLLRHRNLMAGNSAILRARSVARTSLSRDPRHVDSIIVLAETYFLEERQLAGYEVLSEGISRMIFVKDRLILQAELLKHQVDSIVMLEDIQGKLRKIKVACKIGDCMENLALEKELQARLAVLARSVVPGANTVIEKSLRPLLEQHGDE